MIRMGSDGNRGFRALSAGGLNAMLQAAFPLFFLLVAGPVFAAWPAPDWSVTSFSRTGNGDARYLASYTDTSGTTYFAYRLNEDMVWIREYDPLGAPILSATIETDGAGITAMAADSAGNVILAGYIYTDAIAGVDFYIAKYDGTTLDRSWVYAYNSGSFSDFPFAVTVDSAGNAVVAGRSSGFSDDAAVVSVSPAGVMNWDDIYDDAGNNEEWLAVAADGSGNVYLAGDGTLGALTAGYDSSGTQLWFQDYNQAGFENGRAAAWDPTTGTLIVAGDDWFSFGVARIDPLTGLQTGFDTGTGGFICIAGGAAVDSAGNVRVSGMTFNSNYDLCVASFDGSLSQTGLVAYDQGGDDGMPTFALMGAARVGVDGNDKVYLSGRIKNADCTPPEDLFLRRYGSPMTTEWTEIYDGPAVMNVAGAVSIGGDAYTAVVAGYDPFLLKHDSAGAPQWTNAPAVANFCPTGSNGIATDGTYIYQSYSGNDLLLDFGVAVIGRHSTAGVWSGSTAFSRIRDAHDGPLTVDAASNAYLAGWFSSTTDFEDNYYVAKYDSSGNPVWAKAYSWADDDDPAGITVDAAGDLYVAMNYPHDGIVNDSYGIVKLDATTGAELWQKTYTVDALHFCFVEDLRSDGGYVYMAGGEVNTADGDVRGRLIKWDLAGNVVWTRSYNGGLEAVFNGLAVDPAGNADVTGKIGADVQADGDFLTVSYDPFGNERWANTYDTGGKGDMGYGVAMGGAIFIAGDDGTDATLMKYTEPVSASLKAALAVSPNPVGTGIGVEIVMTVTNTGTADATGVDPWLDINTGAGNLTPVSGPAPAGPVTIVAGTAQSFTWVYTTGGTVVASLTATATGTDSGLSIPVLAAATVFLDIAEARLIGSLSVVPGSVAPTDPVMLVLTVTNTGVVGATGVTPEIEINTGAINVTFNSGPAPAAPQNIPAGGTVRFTWQYTADVAGFVTFTATATGTDAGTGGPVDGASSAALGIVGPCALASGTICTFAGDGNWGYNGDGIPAQTAQLAMPRGVAVDSAGNVYIADSLNQRIRRVDAVSGLISTFAGTGVAGYNGDGIPANTARLNDPYALAVDAAGNVYITEESGNRIRKVNAATGIITTVAGTGILGYNGDGILATAAWINQPLGVAVDGAGNIYIADSANERIRKVDAATQKIFTVAGTGVWGYSGDGGPAVSARVNYPHGIAVDRTGNLYICDNQNNRIRKVVASGTTFTTISTVVGDGTTVNKGEGINPLATGIWWPNGIAFDSGGNLYFAEWWSSRVSRVDAVTGLIYTAADDGIWGYNGDGIWAPTAQLDSPGGIAFDPADNLYIADMYNHRVRRVGALGHLVAALAATPNPVGTGTLVDIVLTVTKMGTAGAIGVLPWIDINTGAGNLTPVSGPAPAGPVLIAAGGHEHFTWVYTTGGTVAASFTATATGTDSGLSIPVLAAATVFLDAKKARLAGSLSAVPGMVAPTDPVMLVLTVTNTGDVGATGVTPEIEINTGAANVTLNSGPAPAVPQNIPAGGTVRFTWQYTADVAGIVAFTATATGTDSGAGGPVDGASSAALGIVGPCALASGTICTFAGDGTTIYNGDGIPAEVARLAEPLGAAVDSAGNVYIADYKNHRVRRVDAASGLITTFAGTGVGGYNGDWIPAVTAQLNGPYGVAVDTMDNLYISEALGNRVRKVDAVTGIIETVAGIGFGGFTGDGNPAILAKISNPAGLAVDGAGNLYIADYGNNRIRKVDAATQNIFTVAGAGTAGYKGDGGQALTALLSSPNGVAIDGKGDLYIGDYANNRIRRVTSSGTMYTTISTVAGDGTTVYKGEGISPTTTGIAKPAGVAFDGIGNLYFAEYIGNRIRRVDAATGLVTTAAGNGTFGYNGDGIWAPTATLSNPVGIAFDPGDNLYIADNMSNRVRRVGALGHLGAALAVTRSATSIGD